MGNIKLYGVRTNNLKGIDVEFENNALNLVIGPSGSGKSSLVYETLAEIGMHDYLALCSDDVGEPRYALDSYENLSVTVPLVQINNNHNVRSTIGSYFGFSYKINHIFASVLSKDVNMFNLNDENHICPECHGLGYVRKLDVNKVVNENIEIENNPFRCWNRYSDFYKQILKKVCSDYGINYNLKFSELTKNQKKFLLYGESDKKYQIFYKHGKSKSSRTTKYYGVMTETPMRLNFKFSDRFYSDLLCPKCKGKKCSDKVNSLTINDIGIGDFGMTPFSQLVEILKEYKNKTDDDVTSNLIDECLEFVNKAVELNLGHLYFNRSIPTLSGGELQRLRLVNLFVSQLSSLTIILDEPLAGLSGKEKQLVYKNIIELTKKHTLVVVDHSEIFIKNADRIMAIGPGSGKNGGKIIDSKEYLKQQKMEVPILTNEVLNKRKIVKKSDVYHYRGINITYAYKTINSITGPSGIGKTTILKEYFPMCFDDYIYVDQKAIEGNVNSNVATLLKIASRIYKHFSSEFNMKTDFFSNATGKMGACLACEGRGYNEYRSGKIICSACGGSGFKTELKKYKLHKLSVEEMFDMTIDEAILFWKDLDKKIYEMLMAAQSVALGHLKLSQSSKSLSGGENLRLKLMELEEVRATVLGIDEPFKGLNPQEVFKIITFLEKQKNKGKTIFVVDHTDFAQKYFGNNICIDYNEGYLVGESK